MSAEGRRQAPRRDDGLAPYVVVKKSMWDTAEGRPGYVSIQWAANLAEAKRHYGWTRELHTTVTVRRARVEDMPDDASSSAVSSDPALTGSSETPSADARSQS